MSDWRKAFKRLVDMSVSALFLSTIFPFTFLTFGILIKLSSKGPVIFRQERHGLNGKVFTCYKFRTMVLNDEADTESCSDDDPRVTTVGKLMRVTFIDELPQFYNVLKGDMSLIGPRPHMLYHTKIFSEMVENYSERLSVRPGLTGLAQMMGYNGEVKTPADIRDRVRLDRFYIRHWSPLLDLWIFFKSFSSFIRFRH